MASPNWTRGGPAHRGNGAFDLATSDTPWQTELSLFPFSRRTTMIDDPSTNDVVESVPPSVGSEEALPGIDSRAIQSEESPGTVQPLPEEIPPTLGQQDSKPAPEQEADTRAISHSAARRGAQDGAGQATQQIQRAAMGVLCRGGCHRNSVLPGVEKGIPAPLSGIHGESRPARCRREGAGRDHGDATPELPPT